MSDSERQRILDEQLAERGVDVAAVERTLRNQVIETPSWGYGNSGTRFGVFRQPGAARDIHERLADAAQVHELTGICPKVAIHVPWDRVDDYGSLAREAEQLGVRIGSVNPNLFQDAEYKLGSFGNPDAAIRRRAVDHVLECIEAMRQTGSKVLSLWFADGTNYPGQDGFVARKRRFEECLAQVHDALPDDSTMLIEYKPFEPAFYHTDIADWGMSQAFCRKLGDRAKVLVDLGHHLPGTNIEHLVAFLLDEKSLGGFHFNNRKYADDDLTAGSIDPYETFRIHCEIVEAEAYDLEFMIDQCHNIKPKLEAMITTVMFLQQSLAQALCVDRRRLAEARAEGDVVMAERCLQQAFTTDVAPLVGRIRQEMGNSPDPLMAYRMSKYQVRIDAERKDAKAGGAGWA